MLELKKITKIYETEGFKQKALDGVSVNFRKNEFASILGPSGSGKTTLLNIIGGLDKYDSGDLVINEISTKKYDDRDWDAYRNHRVGFVFQSYNLITHQSILANVELALTLSGVSKTERRNKAKKALKTVGLLDHMNKRPNQMSGGQMQRVAIARALINDPDILLADEPTGALDSETSVQIMNLLTEIAKEKLVIMVTHNGELAEEYSNRIIKLKDGRITDDSNPYDGSISLKDEKDKTKKTSMNLLTALSLSLNNLMTKKGRTFLTAFAGSIGIIGIALILSLSNGVQEYIKRVETDTLSSYPISIESNTMDATSMMSSFMQLNNPGNHELDKIYSNDVMNEVVNTMATQIHANNLKEFKKFIEDENNGIIANSNAVKYSYNLDLQLYKTDTSEGIVQVNPNTVFETIGLNGYTDAGMMSSFMTGMDVWTELLDNKELLSSQYDVVAGSWPNAYNEIVLIVDENNEVSDFALYSLGLKDQNELSDLFKNIMNGVEMEANPTNYTYDDILNLTFKLLLNADYYAKENNVWLNNRDDEKYMKKIIEDAVTIKVVGIIRPNADSLISSTTGGIGYTSDLTKYVIESVSDYEVVKEQLANPEVNVLTGLKFESSNSNFDMSSLTLEQQQYLATLSQEELANIIASYTENAGATYEDILLTLGIVELDNPSVINIYPKDFESKEAIIDIISDYNEKQTNSGNDDLVINYTDFVGLLMSSVTTIINMITYVLVAFVAISLVVSSIMIAIITYISVLERTKEIGILRAIGASKKDVSRVFNAETIIEGIIAGVFGIGITYVLVIIANIIIKSATDISNLAVLPLNYAVILILISVVLTVVAGLIPARMASKKDPVEALRSE